jgi:integrase
MATFRSVMAYAASKKYITESQVFKGKLPLSKQKREEFTPQEYRKLHTFARSWVKQARNSMNDWYRTVAYNFVLIMCNTGMRPSEARNLCWRDVQPRTHRDGQTFVVLNVRGKGKHRSLVAAQSVADYLDRIKKISKATKQDDSVFTNFKGVPTKTLYYDLIETLLEDSELLKSSSGKRRSIYCFRHTYATFRLTEGVDVYFLAKQMGTSVQMIEAHYGHINPVKNAERVLMGLPGWEPVAADAQVRAASDEAPRSGNKPRR